MANIKILMGLTNGEQKEFNRFNGLNSVESLSQSSPNSNDIYYGTLENSGTISIADENGVIKSMISNGEIDVSHPNIDIVVNNNKLQAHIGYDSSYADNEKILNVSLGNRLKDLDTLKYKGYVYPDESRSLATLLFDVLSGLKHTLFGTGQELTHEKFVDMLSDKYDENQTLYEYLENTVVEYPYIEANKTYREVIDYFCSIAQMQMFIDDDDNVKFVSARPRSFESLDNSIFIPRSNMFSEIEYDVILKNKYDGVETLKYDVENRVDYFTVVASPSINVDNLSVLEETENIDIDFGQGVGSTAYVGLVSITYLYVKSFYLIGDVTINKSDRQNLDKILKVFDNIKKDDSYTYNNTYNYMSGTATGIAKTSGGITVSNIVRNLNTSEAKTQNSQILTDDEVEYTFNYLTHKISSKSSLKDINQSCIYEIKYNNDDTITICFKILCGKLVTKLYGGSIWSDSQGLPVGSVTNYNLSVELSGTNEYFEPISVDVSVYGNKRTIVFNKVQYNTPNIESAKTKVSIDTNNLFQKDEVVDEVKSNILTDYIKGVSNAKVQVSCSDYYDGLGNKVINWGNGDILRVNDIVHFQNDIYQDGNQKYWKVKGRNFTYDGVPMVDLELEECITKNIIDSYKYGLFNNNLFVSWDKLIERGDIAVDGSSLISVSSDLAGKLVVSDSIRVLDAGCFQNCNLLYDIILPDSITTIGGSAFKNCSLITSVSIPSGVTSIGNGAFEECLNLKSVTIPDTVTYIGNRAFVNCSKITNIEIPDSVTSIGHSCFAVCSSLESIKLSKNITEIKYQTFEVCSSLKSIDVPYGVTKIGDNAFYKCSSLTHVIIPDTVTSLGQAVFTYCSALEHIYFPSSLTQIYTASSNNGKYTFYRCLSTLVIYCGSNSQPSGFESGWNYNALAPDTVSSVYLTVKYGYTREQYELAVQ